MNQPLLAYHSDPALKAKLVKRVEAHRKADRLVAGVAAEGKGVMFRGCAVGCTLGTYDHAQYPTVLGVPEHVARLEDVIFEGLAETCAPEHLGFPTSFLRAIVPSADLSLVHPRFTLALLSDPGSPVVIGAATREDTRKAVEGVAVLYRAWVETGVRPSESAAWSAASAAWSAASAARRAKSAASAAWSAESAASAAWSASSVASAASAARSAAWSAAWRWMRDLLLRLLADAPLARARVVKP